MSLILTKVFLSSSLIFFLTNIVLSFGVGVLEDHKTLIFHHCSSQKLEDPNGEYMDAQKKLFKKLQSQSSQSKFSRTFIMVGDHFEASVSGRFQCRQDLDDHKCNECMKTFQNVSNGFCGNSMAARIQLSGCHVQYEADGYNDIFSLDDELNHKKYCGENQAVISSEYFEQMRGQALVALESEVAGGEGNNGFYSIKHEGFHAMVQCEVGIDECKCATCVVDAVEALEKECVSSISGQVFLGLCYLTYEFNPHEIHGGFHAEEKHKAGFGKIVAIAIGGVAILFIVFLLFRCLKKKDDDW